MRSGSNSLNILLYFCRIPAGTILTGFTQTSGCKKTVFGRSESAGSQCRGNTRQKRILFRRYLPFLHMTVNTSGFPYAGINISQFPVIDHNNIVGSLNEASLMQLLHEGIEFDRQDIATVMGKPLPSLEETTDVSEAYRVLLSVLWNCGKKGRRSYWSNR